MTRIPVLESERLLLRAHRENDLPDAAAMWSDPIVVRHLGGRPFTVEEVWARLLRYIGHWNLKGFGYWAIEEKASGRFAGEIGLADFKRDIAPSLEGAPELGWVLAAWAHRLGFASEAAALVLDWATANITGDRLVCLIHPENTPSLRLAAKLGFLQFQSAIYKETPTLVLERRL